MLSLVTSVCNVNVFRQMNYTRKVYVFYQRLLPLSIAKRRHFCEMSRSDNYAKLFSGKKIAEAYAQFRPDYNAAVYNTILEYSSSGNCEFELAVDVGCGTGQSTIPLSARFKQVIGIDVSEQQIKQAKANTKTSNISFRVGAAEDLSAIQDGTVDLITSAQALHWMDLSKFYPEVTRVLRPGGSFVAYGYGIWKLDVQEAEDEIFHFYSVTLKSYWGMGRKHVEEKYSRIAAPFSQWTRNDDIWQEKEFTVDDFCGYISSWSAYHKYKEDFPDETELSTLCKRLISGDRSCDFSNQNFKHSVAQAEGDILVQKESATTAKYDESQMARFSTDVQKTYLTSTEAHLKLLHVYVNTDDKGV